MGHAAMAAPRLSHLAEAAPQGEAEGRPSPDAHPNPTLTADLLESPAEKPG